MRAALIRSDDRATTRRSLVKICALLWTLWNAIARHAAEIADFARAVKGDDVSFVSLRWADLLAAWAKAPALAAHAAAITRRFGPL